MSKLRKSAADEPCIRCGNPDAWLCHYNGKRSFSFGKGMATKCHDLAGAEFCMACDQVFTEGSKNALWANEWERSEDFLFWCMMTNIRKFKAGVIGTR